MLRKVPIVACPLGLKSLILSLSYPFLSSKDDEILNVFKKYLSSENIFFFNSGTASFYTILETIKKNTQRDEIIIPAYTAAALIIAIKKARLKPVLCDISIDDFNIDIDVVSPLISNKTLAIVGVHSFGIPMTNSRELKDRFREFLILEDCCQALGSKIGGVPVGNFGNISFFSFNRGKNLPTYGGGFISTNDQTLAKEIAKRQQEAEELTLGEKLLICLKILGLSLAIKPSIYGLGYPLFSLFEEKPAAGDFAVKQYASIQKGLALSLMKNIEKLSKSRYEQGIKLVNGLKNIDGLIIPKISTDMQPAFNRLPVVFRDLSKRERVEQKLWQEGIGTSRMYFKPLHHIFDLGYKREDFPQACFIAEHLLTLPTHPLLTDRDLDIIIKVIKNT